MKSLINKNISLLYELDNFVYQLIFLEIHKCKSKRLRIIVVIVP